MRNFCAYLYSLYVLLIASSFANCQGPEPDPVPRETICLLGKDLVDFNNRLIRDHNTYLKDVGSRLLEPDVALMSDSLSYSRELTQTERFEDPLPHSFGTGFDYEEFLYWSYHTAPPLQGALDPVPDWWYNNHRKEINFSTGKYGIGPLKRGDYQRAGCAMCGSFYGHYIVCRYTPIGGASTTTSPETTTTEKPTYSTTSTPTQTTTTPSTPTPTENPDDSDNIIILLVIAAGTVLIFSVIAVITLFTIIFRQTVSRFNGEESS